MSLAGENKNKSKYFLHLEMGLRLIRVLSFLLLFTVSSKANKIISIADGNWEDNAVWSGGSLPGVSVNDTVEINHCIFFNENLQFNSGAYVTIEDSGKICGHHTIYLLPGSEFDILERSYFDTIFSQGYLYVNNNSQAWVWQFIQFTGQGHGLFIGPAHGFYYPFVCSCDNDSIPPQDTLPAVNDSIEIEIYPNPFSELLYIKTHAGVDYMYLTDDAGRLIMRKKFNERFLDLKNLEPAAYFLNFVLFDGKRITRKIVKL